MRVRVYIASIRLYVCVFETASAEGADCGAVCAVRCADRDTQKNHTRACDRASCQHLCVRSVCQSARPRAHASRWRWRVSNWLKTARFLVFGRWFYKEEGENNSARHSSGLCLSRPEPQCPSRHHLFSIVGDGDRPQKLQVITSSDGHCSGTDHSRSEGTQASLG